MAKVHRVTFKSPAIEVTNRDYIFHIRKGKSKFGRLKISRGAVVFMPAYGGVKKQWRLTWSQLAEAAKKEGKKVKK